MAGIGVQLNKIFDKGTITTSMYGIGFSIIYTIAPMFIVIGCLIIMYIVLDFDSVGYLERDLFSSTILYIFIFSMVTSSPFNTVLSKFQSDRIYEKKYEDIRPSIYVGTITNLFFSSLVAIPFCTYAVVVGNIAPYYIFTAYMGYLSCSLTFCYISFNNNFKQFKKIFWFFILSMGMAILLSMFFKFILGFTTIYSILLALTIGFLMVAIMSTVNILRFFPKNSRKYKDVVYYYKIYWKVMLANFLYTIGLFAHNFVYWSHPTNLVVFNTLISNQSYDMASYLAMFTNVSASVFLISKMEMNFNEKYKDYMEAVIGGKLDTIKKTKKRMFGELSTQIHSLVNLQFVLAIIIYFLAIIILPIIGFSGLVTEIYPQLSVGYFVLSLMYALLLFLYYFNDLNGTLINGLIFSVVSIFGSLLASKLSPKWYGLGFTIAAFLAFTFSYFRLRWIERNLDTHVFCKGTIIEQVREEMPKAMIYKKTTTITNEKV